MTIVRLQNITRSLAPVATLFVILAARVAAADPVQVGAALHFGGHEYRLYAYQLNDDRDWASAKAFAEGIGARLVSINSAAENQFLVDNFVLPTLPGTRNEGWFHSVWTGGTDQAQEGTWVWDGDLGAGAFWIGGPAYAGGSAPGGQFANWLGSEPNNARNDNYLALLLQGQTDYPPGSWYDAWGGQPDYLDPIGGLIVEIPDQSPVATDDFYGMNQSSSLSVPSTGVLANDSDPDNNALSAQLETGPTHAASFQFNPDGSFVYTPLPYFFGDDTFTYKAYDGTASSEIATVHMTVREPGSQGFITGGGKFFQAGSKCTFGFVAKAQGSGVQGQLEFQDHDANIDAKSQSMQWIYSPNQVDGYFSGTCRLNGVTGYTFFVQVHDRGEPGSTDDLSIWIFDSLCNPVYTADALLAGGNIVIHVN